MVHSSQCEEEDTGSSVVDNISIDYWTCNKTKIAQKVCCDETGPRERWCQGIWLDHWK